MEASRESIIDKWSLTAYSGVQHQNGLYIDALLSYGLLKGNIANDIIGETAKINDGKVFSASATLGQKLGTSAEGLIFEPQAQLVYQRLMLKTISDADNFEVDMGQPRQWLMRIGGRLTKDFATIKEDNTLSFYSKVNFIRAFGDGGVIKMGENFPSDSMGSSIEGGIGVNARFSHKISLHGDVSYWRKIQETGISGATVSGGVQYRF
ncbi:autotransporter outer membrane beta-barrel domain-containing protein [Bartonella australis]|nr:autotransporter outer membrane beta-barrel domain-containing protein [Bartonella australis]